MANIFENFTHSRVSLFILLDCFPQRFNLTLEGSNILEIESNSASELYFDLSGCRISGKINTHGSSQQNLIVVIVLHFVMYLVWQMKLIEWSFPHLLEPPYTVTYGYDEHRVGTCSRTICHAKTGKLEGGERCGNGLCNSVQFSLFFELRPSLELPTTRSLWHNLTFANQFLHFQSPLPINKVNCDYTRLPRVSLVQKRSGSSS